MMSRQFYLQCVLLSSLFCTSLQRIHIFDCPSDWLSFETHCYKFVSFPEETYESARAACAIHGAALVSVNDASEHYFISDTIQRTSSLSRAWYTSGVQLSTASSHTTHRPAQAPRGDSTTTTWGSQDRTEVAESQSESDSRIGQYKWLGDGQTVRYNVQFWQPNVDFSSGEVIAYVDGVLGYGWSLVHEGDKLPYICEISQEEAYRIVHNLRGYDYGNMSFDPNNLERGPAFVSQPESIVLVGRSKVVSIECMAIGNPLPTYQWLRGPKLKEEITPTTNDRYTLTNGKLVMEDPMQSEDSGQYQCVVENKFGKILGNPLQLSFGYLGEFSNVPDAAVRAKAFEGVAIQCSRIAFRPAIRYQWLKGDVRTFVRPQLQPYIFMSANGKLYFSEVTSADEGDYRCIAILAGHSRHTVGSSQPPTRTSLPITLLVQDQAAKADWGPEIQNDFIAVFPNPPLQGQDVRLECFAYGSSQLPFFYQWVRTDRPIPRNAKIMDHNRVLYIPNARLEDSGNYTCTVSRGTQAQDSKTFYLDLLAKPYFIIPLQNQHVDVNSQLTWRCVARGKPNPVYTWYKNGEILRSVPGDVTVSGSTLTIKSLQPDKHDGMYQCGASNEHGRTMSSAQLRVLSFAPSFFKRPLPPLTNVAVGGNATLMCDPEGAPQPTITWLKNGGELPANSGHYRQLRNGYLFITDLSMADAGRYTCKAVNEMGEDSSSTDVKVGRQTVMTSEPKNTQVVVNQTAFFFCQASHNPLADMVYIWKFNGRTISFDDTHYLLDLNPIKTGLYIRNADFRHAGSYTCTAETNLEEDSRTAELTVLGPPGEPAGVFVEVGTVTTHSVQLRWTPGPDRGGRIVYYIVEAATNFNPTWKVLLEKIPALKTLDNSDTAHHIHQTELLGLKPGTGYRFRMRATNVYGVGPPSISSTFIQTPSAPPSKAPDNVRGGGGSVGDLTIVWDMMEPEDHGGTGIGYNTYHREKDGKDGRWVLGTVKGNVEKHVTLVGKENYYLEYEAKVQAFNDLGPGPNSTIQIVYSAADMPIGVPTNIGADGFNGTCLEIWWDPVPDTREFMRGKVMGYQINYWPNENNDEHEFREWMKFTRYPGQVSGGIIIGLEVNGWTWVDVQVYNEAGLGPKMEPYTQETLHFGPLLYPEEVRIYSHGHDSVRVWWRGIYTTIMEDSVTGFKLYYWPASEDYRSADIFETDGIVDTCVLTGLDKGIIYALRVAGVSPGGDGKKTPTKYFTLGGSVRIDSTTASSMTLRAAARRHEMTYKALGVPVFLVFCICKLLQT